MTKFNNKDNMEEKVLAIVRHDFTRTSMMIMVGFQSPPKYLDDYGYIYLPSHYLLKQVIQAHLFLLVLVSQTRLQHFGWNSQSCGSRDWTYIISLMVHPCQRYLRGSASFSYCNFIHLIKYLSIMFNVFGLKPGKVLQ